MSNLKQGSFFCLNYFSQYDESELLNVPEGTRGRTFTRLSASARNPPTAACFESMTLLDAAEPQELVGAVLLVRLAVCMVWSLGS